jgi:hypothetical protein
LMRPPGLIGTSSYRRAEAAAVSSRWWLSGRRPCKRRTLALTYWCGSTSIIVAPSSGRMYDFDFDLVISSCLLGLEDGRPQKEQFLIAEPR